MTGAPAFVASSGVGVQNTGTAVSATMTSNPKVGDLLIGVIDCVAGGITVPPSGWNLWHAQADPGTGASTVYWKIAAAADITGSATFAATISPSSHWAAQVVAYTNIHGLTPISSTSTTWSESVALTTTTPATATPGQWGCLIVWILGQRNSTPGSGSSIAAGTIRNSIMGVGSGTYSGVIADNGIVAPSAIVGQVITVTGASGTNANAGHTLVLNPVHAGGLLAAA